MGMQRKTHMGISNSGAAALRVGTAWFWGWRRGFLNHVAEEAGQQDVAAIRSSLLAVWKQRGERSLAGGP